MATTKIEWCEKSWNPVTGCTKISPGCKNCYADRMSKRLAGRFGYPKNEPFKVTLHPDKLSEPKKWRKPSRIFVCSMGDFLHEDIDDKFIDEIIYTIEKLPQHRFLFLTKRPENAKEKLDYWKIKDLKNFWLGVTAENQDMLEKRWQYLRQIPAAVKFISMEPTLGPMNIKKAVCKNMSDFQRSHNLSAFNALKYPDWVISGCESGPKRRPCKIEWVRSVVEQCREASVPVFCKQIHINGRVSKNMSDWPEDLRIRQYPKDGRG